MNNPTWTKRLTSLSAAVRIAIREEIMREQAILLRSGNSEGADALERVKKRLEEYFADVPHGDKNAE